MADKDSIYDYFTKEEVMRERELFERNYETKIGHLYDSAYMFYRLGKSYCGRYMYAGVESLWQEWLQNKKLELDHILPLVVHETDKPVTTPKDRQKKYEVKRLIKPVSFNMGNKEDRALYEFAQSLNFSYWVKEKLKEEKGLRDKDCQE